LKQVFNRFVVGGLMVSRVVVVSPPGAELSVIKSQLRDPLVWQVKEILGVENLGQELNMQLFDIMIIRFATFGSKQVEQMKRIAAHFCGMKLIASSSEVDPMARYDFAQWSRQSRLTARLISEPAELNDINMILSQMVRGDVNFQRMHSRKRKSDEAELFDGQGLKASARFLDFSQMGAKMQVTRQGSGARLQKNQRVSVKYFSSVDPSRIHHIEALVIWEGPTAGPIESLVFGSTQTVGLRFLAFA
jgi:hypothetical protein